MMPYAAWLIADASDTLETPQGVPARFGATQPSISAKKETADRIVSILANAGYDVYFVGGSVRDELLGRTPDDYDIVTSAPLMEIERLLKQSGFHAKAVPKHRVVETFDPETQVETDVAEYRIDVSSTGRQSEEESIRAETLADDLERRDFTIGAIAKNAITGEIIDLYGGKEDLLKNNVLRTVGDPRQRFAEDPLRVLRGLRFAATFNLDIDPETWEAMKETVPMFMAKDPETSTYIVPRERISQELKKAMKAKALSKMLSLADQLGLLPAIELYELSSLKGLEHGPHHPEGDPLTHTLKVIEQIEQQEGVDHTVLLAALFHDIGKKATQTFDENGVPHFYGHENVGAEMAEQIMRNLHFDNETIRQVKSLVQNHMRLHHKISDKNLKKLYNLFSGEIDKLIQLTKADIASGSGDFSMLEGIPERVEQIRKSPPPVEALIDGSKIMEILGVEPGPIIGKVKQDLIEKQYEGKIKTPEEAEAYVRENAERFKINMVKPSNLTVTEILCNV